VEYEDLARELEEHQNEKGELYLLLIGDHGGGTFKLLLQDLQRKKPNSPFSGFLIGEMDAKDKHENLKKAFKDLKVSK